MFKNPTFHQSIMIRKITLMLRRKGLVYFFCATDVGSNSSVQNYISMHLHISKVVQEL